MPGILVLLGVILNLYRLDAAHAVRDAAARGQEAQNHLYFTDYLAAAAMVIALIGGTWAMFDRGVVLRRFVLVLSGAGMFLSLLLV